MDMVYNELKLDSLHKERVIGKPCIKGKRNKDKNRVERHTYECSILDII